MRQWKLISPISLSGTVLNLRLPKIFLSLNKYGIGKITYGFDLFRYTKTVNPLGKVPAIDYNGTILYESLVLCEFLEDLHPEHPVLGYDNCINCEISLIDLQFSTDPVTRAKIRLWISWIDGKFIPSWYGFLTAKTPEDQVIRLADGPVPLLSDVVLYT